MGQFEADVKAALDQCAPLRIFTKRSGNVLNRWLSTEAVQAKREARRCERQYFRYRTAESCTKLRAARAQANIEITKSRSSLIAGEIANSRDNPLTLWRTVNRLPIRVEIDATTAVVVIPM